MHAIIFWSRNWCHLDEDKFWKRNLLSQGMVRRKVTTVHDRLRFVSMWMSGKTFRDIAREAAVRPTTVSRWVRRWIYEGHVQVRHSIRPGLHQYPWICSMILKKYLNKYNMNTVNHNSGNSKFKRMVWRDFHIFHSVYPITKL